MNNLRLDKLIKFVLVGLVGLGINGLIQLGLRHSSIPSVLYIILGNAPGVLWNFFGNAMWTFRQEKEGKMCDEPESFLGFLTYSALRAIQHPKIIQHVNPVRALISELAMQRHACRSLERAVRKVSSCSHTAAFMACHENTLPEYLLRYRARQLLFALTRLLKPQVVVETGVGGGYASAHILEAMRMNGGGQLWSVDDTSTYNASYYNLPEDLPCGGLVPTCLRNGNWTLMMGGSEKELPTLLAHLGQIDVFIHDSLHTESNMLFEYELAWKHLRPGGLLLSHDIWSPWVDFAKAKHRDYLVYQHYGVMTK